MPLQGPAGSVVLLSAEYPPLEGGIGDYTRRLALALRGMGVEVAILTSAGAAGLPDDPLAVHPWVRDWGWGSLAAISRFLHQHHADVVHLQYQSGAYRMHPAIHFVPEVLRRFPAPPRLIVTMHDLHVPYLFPKAGPLRHWIVAHLLRRAAAVVVTNGADLARLGGESTPTPVPFPSRGRGTQPTRDLLYPLPVGSLPCPPRLIPLASSLPAVRPAYSRAAWRARLGVGPAESLLGYWGLLHPSKGADVLLEALVESRRSGRLAPGGSGGPVRLLLVGGGTGTTDPGNVAFAEALRRQIAQWDLEGVVLWTGPCPAEDAAAHLKACDLIVLPYRDGASFRRSSLVACLALGCPVVTTAPLDPAEVWLGPDQPTLVDGQNVALVPPNDAPALAAVLLGLLVDPRQRERLAEGAGRLREAFCWEKVGRTMRDLYEEVTLSRTC